MMKTLFGRSPAAPAAPAASTPSTANPDTSTKPTIHPRTAKPTTRSPVIRFIGFSFSLFLEAQKNKPPRTGGTARILVTGRLLRHGALFKTFGIQRCDRLVGIKFCRLLDRADGPAGLELNFDILHTLQVGKSLTDSRCTPGGSGLARNVEDNHLQVRIQRSRRTG